MSKGKKQNQKKNINKAQKNTVKNENKAKQKPKKKGKKYFLNDHNIPRMLFADKQGNIYDHPYFLMAGMSFDECVCPGPDELVSMPFNGRLFYLPDCKPIGFDPYDEEYVVVDYVEMDDEIIECFAVSAFMPPGYARLYLPAADYTDKHGILPLWSYTAVGMDNNENFYVAGFQVEDNYKWNPENYDDREMMPKIDEFHVKYPENRLMHHLTHCATEYHCFAAKNLFLQRWEAPLPISRKCNSRCLGCISLQPKQGTCASHERIGFKPSVEEIVELAVPHLEKAEHAMVSFGQGCEGEPLTEWKLIYDSIIEIRKHTQKGSINLNTNGSLPDKVEKLVKVGLNSIRISLNSVIPEIYNEYFKPVDYKYEDVIETVQLCRENDIFTMINYLIFPGVNDTEEEFDTLCGLLDWPGVDFIHFKNLCIDPEYYVDNVSRGKGKVLGIRALFELLRKAYPDVEIGYFNKNIGKFIGYD